MCIFFLQIPETGSDDNSTSYCLENKPEEYLKNILVGK